MRERITLVLAVVMLTAMALGHTAHAQEKRYALLIGNQSYDASVGALKNPHNDIAVVAEGLTKQGFEILPLLKDARRSAILGAVRELANKLRGAGPGSVGFLYYSGHGAAEKDTNVNYLIPIDAKDPGSAAFWDDSVKLDDLMRVLDQARGAVKFVVFDACRNELQLPTRDTTKGLVPVAEQQGFFVAYASAPGRTASDRGERSGPYAAALVQELNRQGLDHLNLFQNVKESVIAATGGAQHPWESNGLTRRVYLTGEPTMPADMALWESVRTTSDIPSLQRYLERFPKGVFASTAQQMIDRLTAEAAQRQAALQFEVERKAQEAKLSDELRKALDEARAARAAVAAAETRRAAAEMAAREASQQKSSATASEASKTQEVLTAAEERFKVAEQRLAALEKDRESPGSGRPASNSKTAPNQDEIVKRAAIETDAIRRFREETARETKSVLLFYYMDINKLCELGPLATLEVVKAPAYGAILFRDEPRVARMFTTAGLEHCVGTKGMARVAYYIINDADRERGGTDTVSIRVRYDKAAPRIEEFDIKMRERTATRTKVTRAK